MTLHEIGEVVDRPVSSLALRMTLNSADGERIAQRGAGGDGMLGVRTKSALILCGGGNNGGDGLAMARHLHNWNVEVKIASMISGEDYRDDAGVNASIVKAMGLGIVPLTAELVGEWRGGLIVDAIFGTGLSRAVDTEFVKVVQTVEQTGLPVLAVDVPSGLDCDTGLPLGAAMRADVTATFVARKVGFANPASREYTVRVVVGDIGASRELIEKIIAGK